MKVTIPPEIKQQVLERDKACTYCGRLVVKVVGGDVPVSQRWRALDDRGATFHFEHKVPLAAGGEDTADNICLACPECNLSKARTHAQRMARAGKPALARVIKVSDEVYGQLDGLKLRRETFSEVVERLIKVYDIIWDISEALGPGHYLKKQPPEQLDAIIKARLARED